MPFDGANFEKVSINSALEELFRKRYFEKLCPRCGEAVPPEHSSSHYGFCNEPCLNKFQIEHRLDAKAFFLRAQSERDQIEFLTPHARELGVSIEFLQERIRNGHSINDIRRSLAEERAAVAVDEEDRKAA